MENEKKNISGSKYKLIALVAIVLVIVFAGIAVFFYIDSNNSKEQTPDVVAEKNLKETERVVGKLDKILFVSGDVEPTVARVEDPTVLQKSNPDFYKNIVVGDYLILYPQRAVIYRESENKIINVAPIINTDQLKKDANTQAPAETDKKSDKPTN